MSTLYVNSLWTTEDEFNANKPADENAILGVNAFASFAEALNNIDENTSRIEIAGEINETPAAGDVTHYLNQDLTIAGGNISWPAGTGKYYFYAAEGVEKVTVRFENVSLKAVQDTDNDPNCKKTFFVGNAVNVVVDKNSDVEIYNAAVYPGGKVTVEAGGRFVVAKEAFNLYAGADFIITGTVDEKGNIVDAAETFLNCSQNINGNVEITNGKATIGQYIRLNDNKATFTANNSVVEIGKKFNLDETKIDWYPNQGGNGAGILNVTKGSMVIENGSALFVANHLNIGAAGTLTIDDSAADIAGDITNDGTINIKNGTFEVGDGKIGDAEINYYTAPPTFDLTNNGTINVSGENGKTGTFEADKVVSGDYITFKLAAVPASDLQNCKIEIYNADGELVNTLSSIRFNRVDEYSKVLDGLGAGDYTYKVFDKDGNLISADGASFKYSDADFNVSGQATLNIASMTGGIDIAPGTTLIDSNIHNDSQNYSLVLDGITFKGDNVIHSGAYTTGGCAITVTEGSTLKATGGRFTFGSGSVFTATGELAAGAALKLDAEALETAEKTLDLAGISISGKSTSTMTVTNAYVNLGNVSTAKNSSGTFNFNFTNSYVTTSVRWAAINSKDTLAGLNITLDGSVFAPAAGFTQESKKGVLSLINGSRFTTSVMRNYGTVNIDSSSKVELTSYFQTSHGGQYGTINVNGGEFLVSGGNQAFDMHEGAVLNVNGGKFSFGENFKQALTLEKGAAININGGTFDIGTLTNSGTFTVGGASELNGTFTGNSVKFADGTVLTSSNGVTFKNRVNASNNMTFGAGYVTADGMELVNDSVVFDKDANVTVGGTFATYNVSNVKINSGAEVAANSFYINGGNLEIDGKLTSVVGGDDGGFIMNGKGTVTVNKGGVLDVTYTDAYYTTGNMTVDVYGTAKVSFKLSDGQSKFTWNIYDGGSLTAEKNGIVLNNAESAINVYGNATANSISNKGTITIDGGTLEATTALTNAGSLTITGESTVSGNKLTNSGSMTVGKDSVYNHEGNFWLNAGELLVQGYVNSAWTGTTRLSAGSYNTILTVDGTYAADDNNNGKFINTNAVALSINSKGELKVIHGGTFSMNGKLNNSQGSITVIDSTLTANYIYSNGTITIEGNSVITAVEGFSNQGTININVADDWSGVATVINSKAGTAKSDFGTVKIDKSDEGRVFWDVNNDGDLIVYTNDLANTVYVGDTYSGSFGEDLGGGKYYGINAFNSLLDYTAGENTTTLKIAGGSYDTTPEDTATSIIKGGINNVAADGEVIVNKGNLVFTTDLKELTISGDYTTTAHCGWDYDLGTTVWTSGHIRFKGSSDTTIKLDGNFTSSENIQFLKGSKLVEISKNSVLTISPEWSGQFAVYTNVVNYGQMIAKDSMQSNLMVIGQGGALTLSGAKASLETAYINRPQKTDIQVGLLGKGSLIVENGAAVDADGLVLVTADGSISVNNATFAAGQLTNNNDVTLKGTATFDVKDFDNNATLTLDGFNGTLTGVTKLEDEAVTGNIEVYGKTVIKDSFDTALLSVGAKLAERKLGSDSLTIADGVTANMANLYVKASSSMNIAAGAEVNVIGFYNKTDSFGGDGLFASYGTTNVDGTLNVSNNAGCGDNKIGYTSYANEDGVAVVNVNDGGVFNLNTVGGDGAKNSLVIDTDGTLNVNNGGTFNADDRATVVNNGIFQVSGSSTVNADITGNVTLKENATLNGKLSADTVTIEKNAVLGEKATLDAVINGGKLTVSGNANTLIVGANSTGALSADGATFTYGDDVIGNIAITGNGGEFTADEALFNGNSISGIKLNVTNEDGNGIINVNTGLDNINSVNGNTVESFGSAGSKVYYFVDNDVTYLMENKDGQISYKIQSAENTPEIGSFNTDKDIVNPDLDITMKKGTTTIKVGKGKEFAIGSIAKNENGGKTDLYFADSSDATINGSVDSFGNLTVGKDADFDITGALNGKNINQNIKIGAGSTANFSDVYMMGGKNSFSVASGATVTTGILDAVTTLSLANGKANDLTEMTVDGKYTAAAANNSVKLGNYAKLTVDGDFTNGGVESGTGTTFKAGNYSKITVENVDGLAGLTIGKESTFDSASISGTENSNKINIGADSDLIVDGAINLKDGKNSITLGKEAGLTAASISNVQTITLAADATATIVGDVNDLQKLTIGKDADFNAANLYGTEANDKITVSGELNLSGNLDLGSGKNSIALNKDAELKAASIANVQTITLAADADLTAASINGVQKLTLGKAATLDVDAVLEGVQKFTAGNESEVYLPGLNGTEKNDAFTFGNDSTIGSETEKVAFNAYAGNDSIKIGNNAIAHITSIDLGDGKDTVTLGKDSKVFVDEITNVETINASKGSQIITGSDVNFDAVGGSWKNATIMDVDNVLDHNAGAGAVYGNEWDLYDLAAGTTSVMIADETNSNAIYKVYEKGVWDKAVGEITSIDIQFIGSLDASKNYVLAVSVEGADFKNKEDEANKYSFTLA